MWFAVPLAAAALAAASASWDDAPMWATPAVLEGTLEGGPMTVRANEDACACPVGNVSDCCCTFADLDASNTERVHALLKRVVSTPFFAHFKINLCSECRLWEDRPLCVLRDCSVCECEAPPAWAAEAQTMCEGFEEAAPAHTLVNMTVDQQIAAGWPSADAGPQDQAVVVDLRENPERYTGYAGESAARVWKAVHEENCYQGENLTGEQRLYNRVVSGLHSSISLHIAHDYCLQRHPEAAHECAEWGVNLDEARARVLEYPERVENLYVAFAVLLRAVVSAGDAITKAVPSNDESFAEGLQEWEENLLPEVMRLATSCPRSFDEAAFFTGMEGASSLADLHRKFQHLQEIMRCVGCDRCKLWGTMQVLGVSTALRLLFPVPGGASGITRQQAVALVHTLERLSSSLAYTHDLRALL